MRRAAFLLLSATWCMACADDRDGPAMGDRGEAGMIVDGAAPDGRGEASLDAPTWLPGQCEGIRSPLLDQDCLAALDDACSTHDTERDCVGQPTLDINTYPFRCGWARFIRFATPQLCEGMSSSGRCVATFLDAQQGCGNPCRNVDMPNMWDSFVFSAAGELVEKPCAPRGGYLAPLPIAGAGECLGPNPDPVCGCAQAACDGQ